jgi:polysaccharide biosynthesis/export protein
MRTISTASAMQIRAEWLRRVVVRAATSVAILGFCLLACAFGQSPGTAPSNSQADAPDLLLLETGDLVEVQVFDTPELSGKLRVNANGELVLPLGGAVGVRGLTAEQAKAAIEQKLRQQRILREPHVEVTVLEYATQGVTVSGEVKSPGNYPWAPKRTVRDFIATAGGVTASASRTVTIKRRGGEQVLTFQLGSSTQNPVGPDPAVQPGDRITVARSGIVYVVGDVGRPGGYLVEGTETITVLQALALAQGMNKTAKFDARLIRNTPTGRTESQLPLKKILANKVADPTLQDGDIVFVPVSVGKQFADKGVNAILQSAVGLTIWGWQ